MAAQDPLFQLIKSLDSSEKRYFKTNAKKGGEAKSNYLQLFDAIDAQGDEYDEAELKRKHAKKPFVKYLSAEKKYLREQIMKQMRAYRSELSVDNKINELLQDERFYRDKGLKTHREKAIAKAKELGTKYERFHLLNEILMRQIAFIEEFEEKRLNEPVLRMISELKQLSLQQQAFLELRTRSKELFSAYRSSEDASDNTFIAKMQSIIYDVELMRPRLGDYFTLWREFYRANSNYGLIFSKHEQSYENTLSEYELYQDKPHFKSNDSLNYKICVANLISRAHSAGKTSRFTEFVTELKELPDDSFNEQGELFQNIFFLEHLHYINVGDFGAAESLVPQIEDGLSKYAEKINKARLLSFQYNIMIMYFIMHKFKESLIWCNKILEDKSEIKQEVTSMVRVFLAVIHFELGHHDLVENLSRSAYRYLSGKNRIHEFEKILISYLKQMPFSSSNDAFLKGLHELSYHLGQIQLKNSINPFGMDEIELWINSKLTGQKMNQLLAN